MSYKPSKSNKKIRLKGNLSIVIKGKPYEISDSFVLQTDVSFTGLSTNEQETLLNAVEAILNGDVEESEFHFNLKPELLKSQQQQEPSEIDKILAAARAPSTVDLVEASVNQDAAEATAKSIALDILGATKTSKEDKNDQ